MGLTKEQADALGANFGAGMKMGSTCGVLTSALMLLGMKGCTPQQATQLVQRFREKHQDTNCAALLSKAKEEGIPRKAHCDSLVLEMAKILDEEFFAPEQ